MAYMMMMTERVVVGCYAGLDARRSTKMLALAQLFVPP
jgi:hypothetical protein